MSMGMNAETGRWIRDYSHLRQSIQKIVSTRIGSRIERREFGSLIPDLIDSPVNQQGTLLLYAAVVTAIMKHEPRLKINQVSAQFGSHAQPGIELTVEGVITVQFSTEPVSISFLLG